MIFFEGQTHTHSKYTTNIHLILSFWDLNPQHHLNSVINADQPIYPKIAAHIPVAANTNQNTVFGHHSFNASATRTVRDSWSLVSSGLQYPCEADARLNEVFAERYDSFDFPETAANDDLTSIESFLSLDQTLGWFSHVKYVAASAAAFFKGSGTLADCQPTGVVSNQIVNALFPFSFRLCSTARRLPTLSEAMAAMAQTNVEMFPTHPYLSHLGANTREGDFWNIRPIERSPIDKTSYLSLSYTVREMMISKI
ncbi:hypothetical protein Hanom_Chr12g01146861 [Helianthus anomalus]